MIFNPVIRKAVSVGGTASLKDVNFYDYDGTLVYSYTLSEAQALMALPSGPIHDGLVFQGWNWPLEKVKALTRPMNVGAMYITDDGKTRLKIRVWDKARSNVPLYISQTVSNGVTIDWGDGSNPETLDGIGNVNTSHQYAATGDYTISLAAADGCMLGFGNDTSSYCALGRIAENSLMYSNSLREVNVGNNVPSVSYGAFHMCHSLSGITIPDNVTTIDNQAFRYCYVLSSLTIPNRVTTIGSQAFQNCPFSASLSIPSSVASIGPLAFYSCGSLPSITVPDGITSIGDRMFYSCRSLLSIIIPDSVISIDSQAFQKCYSMTECHLKPVTPPTLKNVNAFEGIPSDCIIYVPAGSLEAYKMAENWSAYADYMKEEHSPLPAGTSTKRT